MKMEVLEIVQVIASLALAGAALYLVQFQRRESQAATIEHNVAAAQGSVTSMESVIAELRKQISDQTIELLKTQQEVAKLRRDMAVQEAAHAETVNALNKRVQSLEKQLALEQSRREHVEEENTRLRDGVKKLEEKLEIKEIKPG
jgi:peptidoglycan hydrolase CwlO-like protein